MLLLVSGSASRAAPVDPALVTAKALFEHAEAEYALMRWDQALADYEKAYETKPLPGLLFNIAQCHRQLQHWDKAAYFYRTYLEKQPQAKNRPLAESLLAEMERRPEPQPGVAAKERKLDPEAAAKATVM